MKKHYVHIRKGNIIIGIGYADLWIQNSLWNQFSNAFHLTLSLLIVNLPQLRGVVTKKQDKNGRAYSLEWLIAFIKLCQLQYVQYIIACININNRTKQIFSQVILFIILITVSCLPL